MPLNETKKVASIIASAGGRIVGRTRLQKVAYLLTVTGLDDTFKFSYKHYGPYSEDLASFARLGKLFGDLSEVEHSASWGGSYSIFTVDHTQDIGADPRRAQLAKAAAAADAVELELAATAVFLAEEGFSDPWGETARRKPEKAEGERLEKSKALLRSLAQIDTPRKLPAIA